MTENSEQEKVIHINPLDLGKLVNMMKKNWWLIIGLMGVGLVITHFAAPEPKVSYSNKYYIASERVDKQTTEAALKLLNQKLQTREFEAPFLKSINKMNVSSVSREVTEFELFSNDKSSLDNAAVAIVEHLNNASFYKKKNDQEIALIKEKLTSVDSQLTELNEMKKKIVSRIDKGEDKNGWLTFVYDDYINKAAALKRDRKELEFKLENMKVYELAELAENKEPVARKTDPRKKYVAAVVLSLILGFIIAFFRTYR